MFQRQKLIDKVVRMLLEWKPGSTKLIRTFLIWSSDAFFKENPLDFSYFSVGLLFTFSSKTRSIVPTSNLCRNIQRPKIQLNRSFLETRLINSKEQITVHQRAQRWHTLNLLQHPPKPKTCHISAIVVCI